MASWLAMVPDGTKTAAALPTRAANAASSALTVGVLAVAVVADLGLGHGPAHLGRGPGDGVAAEVDHAGGHAGDSTGDRPGIRQRRFDRPGGSGPPRRPSPPRRRRRFPGSPTGDRDGATPWTARRPRPPSMSGVGRPPSHPGRPRPVGAAPHRSIAASKIRGSGLATPSSSETQHASTSPSRPARASFTCWDGGPLVTTPIRHPARRSRTRAALTSSSGEKKVGVVRPVVPDQLVDRRVDPESARGPRRTPPRGGRGRPGRPGPARRRPPRPGP